MTLEWITGTTLRHNILLTESASLSELSRMKSMMTSQMQEPRSVDASHVVVEETHLEETQPLREGEPSSLPSLVVDAADEHKHYR